ncbi:MAG: hypothetical protein KGN39_04860 [Betaproteobacteria bacterium]|nr:hypothetical protein [Betaproteobacteria bacterium]
MSALQKIEETYLGILRLVIIAVASLLLVASVVIGLLAFSGLNGGSRTQDFETGVKADEVINKVGAEKKKETKQLPQGKKQGGDLVVADPNDRYYVRTAEAVIKFADKYAPGYFQISKDRLVNVSKNAAEQYRDTKTSTEFASGLAETMEKAMSSPVIIKRVEKPKTGSSPKPAAEQQEPSADEVVADVPFNESPLDIAQEIFETYKTLFAEREAEKVAAKERQIAEELERKATAQTQLYIAAGAFASFLFLVFISIVVKIERNLRDITLQPKE